MRPQSAKAKGRRLQQWAADQYKAVFNHLEGNDVRSLSMGASGDDLILSPAALEVLPYNFEMKNCEKFQLWSTIRQTERRNETPDLSPCLVVKRNRVEPLSIIPFGHYAHLLRLSNTELNPDGAVPAPPFEAQVSANFLLQRFGLDVPAERLKTACRAGASFTLCDPQLVLDAGDFLMIQNRWMCQIISAARFNFWKTWDALVERQKMHQRSCKRNPSLLPQTQALVFNRSDDDATVYIAMPFDAHVELLCARWSHLERSKAIQLMHKYALGS